MTLIAASAVAVRLPALQQPLDRDMAGYGTMGWRLLHGDVPYRDLFEQKQPLVYPVYALVHLLSPHHTEAMRLAAMAAGAATACLVYVVMRRAFGTRSASVSALVCVVAGASSYVEGFDLNTEHILVPLTAAAVAVSLRYHRSRSPWMPAAVGVLAGVTVLTKVVGVFTFPAIALPVLLAAHDTRDRVRRMLAFAGGAAVPALAVCGLFAAVGALDDMIDTTVRFNLAYNGRSGPSFPRRLLTFETLPGIALVAALIVGAAHLATDKRTRMVTGTLLVWGVGAWAGAQYGVNGFPHYYAPLVPPTAMLLALPVGAAVRPLPRRWAVLLVQAVVVIGLLAPFARDVTSFVGLDPTEVAVKVYGEQAYVWRDYELVGRIMREEAPPGARAMVWGAESGFYWFSGIPPATRYFFGYPLHLQPRRVLEQIDYLCARPPEIVVLPMHYEWTGYHWAPEHALRLEDYVLVVDYNGTRVYRLQGDGRQPSCTRFH